MPLDAQGNLAQQKLQAVQVLKDVRFLGLAPPVLLLLDSQLTRAR